MRSRLPSKIWLGAAYALLFELILALVILIIKHAWRWIF